MSCSCCGCGSHKKKRKTYLLQRLIIASIILLITFFIKDVNEYLTFSLYLTALIIAGFDVFIQSFKNIIKLKFFDENFLMTIACISAFFIGEMVEGIMVMLFYGVGEYLQSKSVAASKTKISELMNLKPDLVNVKKGNEIVSLRLEEVNINDIIVVKPGEKVGLDGVITFGNTFLDTKKITGESVPKEANVDTEVLGGFVNINGLIEIKVSKEFKDGTINKIQKLIDEAQSKKAKSEKFITKFSKIYTPIVVIAALLVAIIPSIIFNDFETWIYKSLSFLLISCPCALVVSIPVSFFGAIGASAKEGILIKGSNYLEALNNIDTICFDKTGTITKGVFEVVEVVSDNKEELIKVVALAESNSNHPIAKSILNYYNKEVTDKIISYEEISGLGIKVNSSLGEIVVGNNKLMEEYDIKDLFISNNTIIHALLNNKYLGYIIISDVIKDEAYETIKQLKELKMKTIMLSGDNDKVVEEVSNKLNFDEAYSSLLPQDKVEKISSLSNVVFVGDGINDAPVLSLANIGISMGTLGSDAAIEASDIVIMNDDLNKIVTAKKFAIKTRKIVIQNIVFILTIKFLIMFLSIFFTLPIILAIFADVGVSLLAILNARRTIKI